MIIQIILSQLDCVNLRGDGRAVAFFDGISATWLLFSIE